MWHVDKCFTKIGAGWAFHSFKFKKKINTPNFNVSSQSLVPGFLAGDKNETSWISENEEEHSIYVVQ